MIPDAVTPWLAVVGCLFAVGLSTASTILSSLTRGTVRKLDERNPALVRKLTPWLARRDESQLVIHLLLAVDALLLIACAASWAQAGGRSHHIQVLLVAALLVVLGYLFAGEWAAYHLSATGFARYLIVFMPVTWSLALVLFPFSLPLVFWHRHLENWRRAQGEEEERATAEDEIMSLVDRLEDQEDLHTALEADERRMIRGIFDLDQTLVREIMTPRVDLDAIEDTSSVSEVKATIISSGHSRIPVFHESVDHVVGVVYAKDLLHDDRLDDIENLAELYHRPVFIPETKNVGDLLAEFQQTRTHFAVILDEYGGTAGIITFEDILEEIVGEIRDEYDAGERIISTESLPDGSVIIDGRMPIPELNELLDIDIPENEDYDTVAGYIAAEVGRIPQKGETVTNTRAAFEILQADPRRVLKAKVTRLSDDEEEDHA